MRRPSIRSQLAVSSLLAAGFLASCAASLGPGYIVEQQEIAVWFVPQPEARIHVSAEYHLTNTGNRPLDALDVRLPGRRFRPANLTISVDGIAVAPAASPDNPRDSMLRFPNSWPIGAAHTLQFTYDIPSVPAEPASVGFSRDAFYLPAEGWTPALPQVRGAFGFGGVPPKKWLLLVRVPQGFLVHASGGKEKRSAKNSETEYRFEQTAEDLNPFVVAGQFHETRQELRENQNVRVWSLAALDPAALQQTGESLSQMLASFEALFGARGKSRPPLWIVECPSESGCSLPSGSGYSMLLYGQKQENSSEMISRDTVLVDRHGSHGASETLATPALAAGWLGYGQNPGFYEQPPPMSALPAFAAALLRESASGPQVRTQIIARALQQIPRDATRDSNHDPDLARAKGLLLFYALRDRVGADNFQKAMQHMLEARQERGFDITDLISALEQQSHQQVGPFIREWIKGPGVPDEFRAKYAQQAFQLKSSIQEKAK